MIPALKRGEDDVGSYLQKHTLQSPFFTNKIKAGVKVPTLINANTVIAFICFSLRHFVLLNLSKD